MPTAPESRPAGAASRYSRQEIFPPIGPAGQALLRHAHVAIVGCGATGAASAGMLARAGVGTLTILDRDFVEESNLQRQVLFDEADARDSLPKAEAARRKLSAINSDVNVIAHIADLTAANIAALLGGVQLVLDATDNFETRYLLNDYSVSTGTPWIYAAAVGSYAAAMNILPGQAACLACVFPEAPSGAVATCETAGILNSVANLAAAIQTTEALKLLTGNRAAMRTTLLAWDLWTGERSEVNTASPQPGCQVCGLREFHHLVGTNRPHITLCGRNSVQIHEHNRPLDLAALQQTLAPLGQVRGNAMMVRFTPAQKGSPTLNVFADGRALIQGTTDPATARSLYARYIGS